MRSRPLVVAALLAVAISTLYLFQLDGVGILGPDEPRYAAIGRAMAATGDFVTPRLWGSPWFEKPPLLYWMTAAGVAVHLGPELCGRLPVALLSLAFLLWSTWLIAREYNLRVALACGSLLATSAGWIAYSSLCLTDLPLSVCFSAAVFLALPLLQPLPPPQVAARFAAIGLCMGLAVLAKGLVPLALAAPFAWFLRGYWRSWWIAAAACLALALPWYWLVYARNGFPFVQDFFLKHHLERLYSASLLHVQPWYYYVPVLFGGLFPWTPLLGLLVVRTEPWDQRRRFLAAIVIFGFFFFSVSRNKLPGYLLPLLPASFLLIASVLQTRRLSEINKAWLIAPAICTALIPFLAPVLPESLTLGRITAAQLGRITPLEILFIALPVAVVTFARRPFAPWLLVLCVTAGALFLKFLDYPAIDRRVSPRTLWRETRSIADITCDGGTNRDWIFGLSYYRGSSYPPCTDPARFQYVFRTRRRGQPDLEPLHP